VRAGLRASVIVVGIAMAACGESTATPSESPEINGGTGITASLVLSGALQGEVSIDDDGSSLDIGRMGCTQPDLSGEVAFGILFQGHLPGQPASSVEINIAQTQSTQNVANPHLHITFPDAANVADIDIEQNGSAWNTARYGTLSINLSGTTETGAVNAEVSQGTGAADVATEVGISGSWSCTIT
jgi:hypothetical protein